jgi:hypothetical protein
MTLVGATFALAASPDAIAAELSRSLGVVNEELSIVGMALGADRCLLDPEGHAQEPCYLACSGEAALAGRRAVLTFGPGACRAFMDEPEGPGSVEIASLTTTEAAEAYDFLLAVVEALARRRPAPGR